ncbi:MAG: hypothetical protein CMI95_05750 [Pelagibacteraceae bacterium]|nr:hypothetical protein [Pelagibacteraceae bacterium]|tara:strand:- start:20871 stop:22703 length:1833 start_codon:yes stop_codon:yes gene_type:complete
MLSQILFLFKVLSKDQKTRFLVLLFSMILTSFFEILTIIFIFEYISFLSSGTEYINVGVINKLLDFFNLNYDLLTLENLSFILIFVILLGVFSNLLTIYLTNKFSLKTGGEIESKLFLYYMKRDYLFHLNTTSSVLMNNIFELVKRVASFVLTPLMIVLSKVIFLIPLLSGLILYKPKITLITTALFIGIYYIIFRIFKEQMTFLGRLQTGVSEKKFSTLQQGLNGIKEVKLLNKFNFFKSSYDKLYGEYVNLEVKRDVIGKFPRYFLELVTFTTAILFVIFLINNLNYNFNEIIVSISFFLVCAYKIIPAMQQIYYHLTIVKNHLPAVDAISEDLINSKKINFEIANENKNVKNKKFESLEVKNLKFKYKNEDYFSIDDLNFKINKGEKIAITGLSGSGKTTLIHILLGLIKQTSGKVIINGELTSFKNISSWRNLLGYVPQSVFITEKSIRENIGFGISENNIDNEKIKKLLKITKLSNVVNSLPKKEYTDVGERGLRFSGGQQQRLGIARALYNDPEVIVLDEATNALDVLTENEVLNYLIGFKNKITVIMITHRIDTIKKFDKIIFLKDGKLDGIGTYNELSENNQNFKTLLKVKNEEDKKINNRS